MGKGGRGWGGYSREGRPLDSIDLVRVAFERAEGDGGTHSADLDRFVCQKERVRV